MAATEDQHGILYPGRLPEFHREPVPAELRELIRWFWIPRWQLPGGMVSRQEILPFPAANLVVEPAGATLHGPATRVSFRELRGRGWAFGALLRPAGLGALQESAARLRDSETPLELPELTEAVSTAMERGDTAAAVRSFQGWAQRCLTPPDENARSANRLEELIATDRSIQRVEQAAERLHLSVRSIQRLAQRYIGLPPAAVIRRYRLQEALHRLRENPATGIAEVAAELGYADHSHLNADFRRVLGMTPQGYRRQVDDD
ncbi:helix-turn-helix domain-containing protein [Corynebacterium halotolerans]|uniref:AraC family transcriptional regulator n=1 Tax=Corynebacterium halotolerans TaxID=225326 RepID=UPI003CF8C80D